MYVLDMLLASIFNMSINNQERKKCKCCAITITSLETFSLHCIIQWLAKQKTNHQTKHDNTKTYHPPYNQIFSSAFAIYMYYVWGILVYPTVFSVFIDAWDIFCSGLFPMSVLLLCMIHYSGLNWSKKAQCVKHLRT